MVIYVDGVPIGSDTVPGEIRIDAGSFDRPLIIGAELNVESIDLVSGTFDGYVDEVRLYDRALSADEIKVLAANAAANRKSSG